MRKRRSSNRIATHPSPSPLPPGEDGERSEPGEGPCREDAFLSRPVRHPACPHQRSPLIPNPDLTPRRPLMDSGTRSAAVSSGLGHGSNVQFRANRNREEEPVTEPGRITAKQKRYHAKRHLTFIGTSDPTSLCLVAPLPGLGPSIMLPAASKPGSCQVLSLTPVPSSP